MRKLNKKIKKIELKKKGTARTCQVKENTHALIFCKKRIEKNGTKR